MPKQNKKIVVRGWYPLNYPYRRNHLIDLGLLRDKKMFDGDRYYEVTFKELPERKKK